MIRWLVFLLSCLVTAAAHASFLYRMDTRPPEDIFRNGFTPSGANPSLFQHVVGFTCQPGQQTTGLISTSSSETFAIGWGRDNQPSGTHFFVYRIRSSLRFHSAAQSLFHASRRANDDVYEYAGWRYIGESEWITRQPIPANDIIDATEYVSQGPDAPPRRVGAFENPDALDTPGPVNHGPYEWDYRRDDPNGSDPTPPICSQACFNAATPIVKREAPDDSEPDDEPREKMQSILRCRSQMALRLSTILDIIHQKQKTEL